MGDHSMDSSKATNTPKKQISGNRKRWGILGGAVLLVLCCILVIIFGIYFQLQVSTGPVTVTDVRIATTLNEDGSPPEQVTSISANQPRIYCYITITTPKPVPISIKWYRDGLLIAEDQSMAQGWIAFSLDPLPNQPFPEGNYQAEILLYNNVVETVEFDVE